MYARGHAEADGVHQRVQFGPEAGSRAGEAGHPPVQHVQDPGEDDEPAGPLEVAPGRGDDGVDPEEEVPQGEGRGEDDDAGAAAGPGGCTRPGSGNRPPRRADRSQPGSAVGLRSRGSAFGPGASGVMTSVGAFDLEAGTGNPLVQGRAGEPLGTRPGTVRWSARHHLGRSGRAAADSCPSRGRRRASPARAACRGLGCPRPRRRTTPRLGPEAGGVGRQDLVDE